MDHGFHAEWDKKRARSKFGFAVLLVLAGVLLLVFNLGLIPIEYKPILLSWQMLLIAVGVISFLKRQLAGGIILVAVGVFFLLPVLSRSFPDCFGSIPADVHLYWPVLLIVGGIAFLFKKNNCHSKKWHEHNSDKWKKFERESSNLHNEADYVSKEVMFSSSEHIVFSPDFRGGSLKVLFGEIKLDLRKVTQLDANNFLEVEVMFGSAIIYVPDNWHLNLKSSTLFGAVEDKRGHAIVAATEKTIILNIKSACVFGNIEIR